MREGVACRRRAGRKTTTVMSQRRGRTGRFGRRRRVYYRRRPQALHRNISAAPGGAVIKDNPMGPQETQALIRVVVRQRSKESGAPGPNGKAREVYQVAGGHRR